MYITAVIPTKNRQNDLLKAVASIINQSRLPNELIIVDQSVNNEAYLPILQMTAKKAEQLKLNYIHDPSITGLVDAKRVAVASANGDVVCFLEDDIVLEIDYIQSMEQTFVENPKMMGCCGVVTNLEHLSKYYVWFFHLFHRAIFYDQRVGVHGFAERVQPDLIPSRYLSGGTSAFRREVFDRVKFDTLNNFFMLEDIDFSTRANKAFGQVFYINTKARLAHYMSPVNRAVYQQRYQKKLREFIVFYKKHTHGIQDFIALIWLLIGMILEAVFVSLSSHKLSPIKGYFLGLKEGIQWRLKVDSK